MISIAVFMKVSISILLICIAFQAKAQELKLLCRLPKLVKETSGIEENGPNAFWTFNDSGGKPKVYLVNKNGALLKTLTIKNAWNRDWEDIAKDNKGNLYIANIGNNNNANKDLTIFKIPDPSTLKSKKTQAQLISFRYNDQTSFPPSKRRLNFDAEALMWHNNHLYVFTKNRTEPFDGKTHVYRMPDKPGKYVAKKIGTFDTGGRGDMTDHWITACDISPNGSKLALLSSDKVWIFYDFKNDDFFKGKHTLIHLPHKTQKEAICFINEKTLYITDEEWAGDIGRNLYVLKLKR